MLTDADRGTRVHRQELTPVSFLERAGDAHADRIAVVDGDVSFDYCSWRARARRDGVVGLPGLDPEVLGRSEERRVGKECRSRWSPYH